MISLISAFLFSFSANLDNIAIGVSYGVKNIHITICKNIIISFFTSIFTFFSMFLGNYFAMFLSENLANKIGATLLIILGTYSLFKEVIKRKKTSNNLDNKNSSIQFIGLKETVSLILILSINNMAAGVAASVAGINIIFAFIFTFIFSFLFLILGNRIGKKAISNNFIEKYSNIISSLVLIFIGLIEI